MIKEVRFYESAEDSLLKFAVILARSSGKWVFCKHRERTTLEVPGGHREAGESVEEAAARDQIFFERAKRLVLKKNIPVFFAFSRHHRS